MTDFKESLLDINNEIDQLSNDYEIYDMFLIKVNKELNEIKKIADNKERAYSIKLIIPKVEKLGDYLNSLNHKIKQIETNDYSTLKKDKSSANTLIEIKTKSSIKYEEFNKKFLDMIQVKKPTKSSNSNNNANSQSRFKNNSNKGGNYQSNNNDNTNDKNNNDNNSLSKVNQQLMLSSRDKERKQTDSSLGSLREDLKYLRQEDLEMILKISKQTMQISQEMKNSVTRAAGSINTIEDNVLNIKDDLKNANKETTKLYNNNNSSICNYIWLLITCFILVTALVGFIYYKFVKD